ncbi:MAG TPA: IPT/TIG domain-containing protein [Solirubrobacteraceae bacterium]|nr:IPT/TIG domain-containing protein [Solirubrobacteraceae bacterium]
MPAQAHEPYGAQAWGSNKFGQLGDGTSTGPEECGVEKTPCHTTPGLVSELSGVAAVAEGRGHSLALLENGAVMSWGENVFGQLGDGTTGTPQDLAVTVTGLSGVKGIAAGSAHSLALLGDGTVKAWGRNSQGQLGDGTNTDRDAPVSVCAPAPEPCPGSHLSGVAAVAAGETFSLALLENGTVVAWGSDEDGQLGNGSMGGKSEVPVPVSGLSAAIGIAAGESHALALLSGGTVKAWGFNKNGQLGDSSEASTDLPVKVAKIGESTAPATAVAAGAEHSLARLSDGTVVAWGSNAAGQLGDGTSTGPEMCGLPPTAACAKTPVAVATLSGVSGIAAGKEGSLAVASGAVFAWGRNDLGQLGDSTSMGPEACPNPCSTKPVQVKTPDVKGVGPGAMSEHRLAFGPTAPTVTRVSPSEPRKKGTTKVTITGTEFEEATEVKFGSAKASRVVVRENGTIIEATAPAGKGTVDVTVTTPAGTSATGAADRFFYSRPTVKKLSPRKGPQPGGTTVTITGTHFSGVTAVKFGSTEASSFKVKSETEIVAVSPAHAKGRVDVTVNSPNGMSLVSTKDRFRYA